MQTLVTPRGHTTLVKIWSSKFLLKVTAFEKTEILDGDIHGKGDAGCLSETAGETKK